MKINKYSPRYFFNVVVMNQAETVYDFNICPIERIY